MIILKEVAEKLQNILNGTDSETSGLSNPTSFYCQVATEGFHIDEIADVPNGRNFIPVFISSMGGQFNPVKGLKQASYSIGIVFYYPVRFKDDFYALCDFLADVFVGTHLNYGTISGKAVSNISVPQFGEIQDLDLKKLEKWVNDTYKQPIEIMEPHLTIQLTLYLSNAANGLVYGNDVKVDLSFSYNSKTYDLEDVDWDGASLQSNSQPQSEQEEGTNEGDSFPFGTTYGASFKVYPNLSIQCIDDYIQESGTYDPDAIYYRKVGNTYVYVGHLDEDSYDAYHGGGVTLYVPVYTSFYKELLKIWLQGNIQEVRCTVTFTLANDNDLKYTRECYIQSIVSPIEKGQLFALTLTFSKVTIYE